MALRTATLAKLAAPSGHVTAVCLQVEFGVNADAQKFLSKSGKTLADAIGVFTSDMDTLINRTMEDTMVNARQYQAARWVHFLFPGECTSCFLSADSRRGFSPVSFRVEYDAYRVDLEELNLKPRDANTLPKLERAQTDFQDRRERYQKIRQDLSVKVQLLEQNKVRACCRRQNRAGGTRTVVGRPEPGCLLTAANVEPSLVPR